MLILEDLYLGDVRPSERSFKRNSQYAKALDEVVRAGDALTDPSGRSMFSPIVRLSSTLSDWQSRS